MKRLNPNTNQPYRCGDVDITTGMIFRCYQLHRIRKDGTYIEQWLDPAIFEQIKEAARKRARVRREGDMFKRARTAKDVISQIG